MPYFQVIVHGDNILIDQTGMTTLGLMGENGEPIIGFYTTKNVQAEGPASAESKALQMVMAEWTKAPLVNLNRASAPDLEVDKVTKIGFLEYTRSWRQKGFTFYTAAQQNIDTIN